MKTEDILRYDRMYRAMKEALDADIITFGFWSPHQEAAPSGPPEQPSIDPVAGPTYTHLAGAEPL